MTHICVGNLTIIGSDNGLSPSRRQAIIWTNAGIFNLNLRNKLQWNLKRNSCIFIKKKCIWKCRLRNGVHFVSASMCSETTWQHLIVAMLTLGQVYLGLVTDHFKEPLPCWQLPMHPFMRISSTNFRPGVSHRSQCQAYIYIETHHNLLLLIIIRLLDCYTVLAWWM